MNIIITKIGLDIPTKDAYLMVKDNHELSKAISEYGKELEGKNIEIFKKEKNMLITEDGYYFAFFQSDVRLVSKL